MNNNQATLAKMHEMRLHGMARAFQNILETGINHQFTMDELLTQLVDTDWDDRILRKQQRLQKAAGFRCQASIEDIDFQIDRNLDKNMILRLTDGNWIKQGKDVLITGPTGVGKSYIGSALGHHACSLGYRTFYSLTSRLFQELSASKKRRPIPEGIGQDLQVRSTDSGGLRTVSFLSGETAGIDGYSGGSAR